jgi:hypothetical protein
MADGDIEQVDQVVSTGEAEVAVVRSGGIVVLDGPQAVIDRLIAGDPALRSARPVRSSSPAATGALAALAPLMSLAGSGRIAEFSGSGPTVFQLDAAGQAMFDSGALSKAGDGFYRLFGKAADGTFSGHGALKPVTMAPQQLAAAQLALVTVALMAAIKEVQEAVERVEDKVDLLRDILDAERDGEIIGANRALRRRADRVGFDSIMSDTDWHAIDDIGVAVEQQIERLRSFIRKRLAAAEDEGRKISGRLDAVEHARDVAETLALLVVAQDSLFLFQQMRVLRIKTTQPELASAAADEARTLLDQHTDEDADLLQRVRTLVAERVEVEALEVLRFRTANEIVRLAPEVDETLAWFADQRGLPYESFEMPPLPGAAEVVGEVKERGAALASDTKRAIGALTGKMRSRKRAAGDASALGAGEAAEALPSATGDAAQVDPEEPAGRFSRARSSAMGRIRRGDVSDGMGKNDSETGQVGSIDHEA